MGWRGWVAAVLLLLGVGAVADAAVGPWWWLMFPGWLCLLLAVPLVVDEARRRQVLARGWSPAAPVMVFDDPGRDWRPRSDVWVHLIDLGGGHVQLDIELPVPERGEGVSRTVIVRTDGNWGPWPAGNPTLVPGGGGFDR